MKAIVRLSSARLSFGRAAGRMPDSHDWRFTPSNHLTEKKIIDLPYDDYRLPFKPKPSQKMRGTGFYGYESKMLFR